MNDAKALATLETTQFGSLEELAHFLMVEQPSLLSADPETIANSIGVPTTLMSFLMHSHSGFRALLDEYVASTVWDADARRRAYTMMSKRVADKTERLHDQVKAMDYLDRKAGTYSVVSRQQEAPATISVKIVQEGRGDWESDYEPLRFGGPAAQSPSRGTKGTIEVGSRDQALSVTSTPGGRQVEGHAGDTEAPGDTGRAE